MLKSTKKKKMAIITWLVKAIRKKAKGTKKDLKRLLKHKMPILVTSDLDWFDPTIADDCATQAQRLLE